MALPRRTINTVRAERRRVVLTLLLMALPPTIIFGVGGNEKDLYPRRDCQDKGLVGRDPAPVSGLDEPY